MFGSHEVATPADRENGRRIILFSLAWALTYLAFSQLLRSERIVGVGAWLAAIVCTAIGLGALFAYRRFIAQADELTRRIQHEGITFGFGVGVLVALSYTLFEFAGAPTLTANTAGTIMVFGYIGGVVLASLRYR